MHVVQLWEAFYDTSQLLIDCLLHELDFTHVELSNSLYLESGRDDRGRLSLRLGKRDVHELCGVWNLRNLLEVVAACLHALLLFISDYYQ